MVKISQVINAMVCYYAGDARRINHFLKVYGFAKAIGQMQGLDERTQQILEVAAVTHDIGIKISEKLYNSSDGSFQQIEGPNEAKKMLENLGFDTALIERVCWLIAHHHTYDDIRDMDYQVLVEADFLVNAFEDKLSASSIQRVKARIFKTETGKNFLDKIYETAAK